MESIRKILSSIYTTLACLFVIASFFVYCQIMGSIIGYKLPPIDFCLFESAAIVIPPIIYYFITRKFFKETFSEFIVKVIEGVMIFLIAIPVLFLIIAVISCCFYSHP